MGRSTIKNPALRAGLVGVTGVIGRGDAMPYPRGAGVGMQIVMSVPGVGMEAMVVAVTRRDKR